MMLKLEVQSQKCLLDLSLLNRHERTGSLLIVPATHPVPLGMDSLCPDTGTAGTSHSAGHFTMYLSLQGIPLFAECLRFIEYFLRHNGVVDIRDKVLGSLPMVVYHLRWKGIRGIFIFSVRFFWD